jgi:hypothetical protein
MACCGYVLVRGIARLGARAAGIARIGCTVGMSLADTAVGGQPVSIRLKVRRFVCARASCPRRTFVEQVDGLTIRYGRHSVLLRRMLQAVGLALAGRAGARMTERLAVPVSRMTLLRLVRAVPEHVPDELSEVGVDDFAFR